LSIKDKYSIKPIDSFQCRDWIVNKHYAKRLPCLEYCFGLFDGGFLVGVCTFGTPVANNLRQLFEPEFKLIELNRLCVNEDLPKNSLSFLVGSSLNMMPKPIVIVSYADCSQNHHGYIYQATNFIYTGLSAKRTEFVVKGLEHLHNSTIIDMSRGKENRSDWLRKKFGENIYLQDRPRKHRYFMFLGSKKQVKKMKKILELLGFSTCNCDCHKGGYLNCGECNKLHVFVFKYNKT